MKVYQNYIFNRKKDVARFVNIRAARTSLSVFHTESHYADYKMHIHLSFWQLKK